MWWGRSRPLAVYLSGQRIGWRGPEGALAQQRHADPLAALAGLLAELRPGSVDLTLGGRLCRLTVAVGIGGTRDRDEAEAALTATLRAQHVARAHEVARLTARPEAGRPLPVVLLPEETLAVEGHLSRQRVVVTSMRPWWSHYLGGDTVAVAGRQNRPTSPIAAFDGEALTRVSFDEDGRIAGAWTHEPIESSEEARQVVLRAEISTEGVLQRHGWIYLGQSPRGGAQASPSFFRFADWVEVADGAT